MGRLWGSVIWGGLLQAGSDTTRPCIGWRFEFSNDSNGSQWKVPESNLPLKKYHFGCREKTDQEGKAWMWEGFFAGVPLRSGGGIGEKSVQARGIEEGKATKHGGRQDKGDESWRDIWVPGWAIVEAASFTRQTVLEDRIIVFVLGWGRVFSHSEKP